MVCFFMSSYEQSPVETEWERQPLLAERTMTLDDAAHLYEVKPVTVRRWISEGRVRAYRFGPRRIRVEIADLEAMFTPLGPGEV